MLMYCNIVVSPYGHRQQEPQYVSRPILACAYSIKHFATAIRI